MLSVGLLGATGYMGGPFCSALTAASRRGQLKLVIVHRPSSDTSRYPKDIERRSVDLERGDRTETVRALSGLQVVM